MKVQSRASYLLVCTLLGIGVGCGISAEEYNRLAEEEYLRKVEILKKERIDICNKDADTQAEAIADSIIRHMAINPLGEEQYRPYVPPRPDYVPTDTSEIFSKRSVKPLVSPGSDKR